MSTDPASSEPTTPEPTKVGPFTLTPVWPEAPVAMRDRVAEFWKENKALPENAPAQAAENRAKQLVVVAEHQNGDIAAVSTAFKQPIKQLGFPCFAYRTFVAKNYRQMFLLSLDILKASYQWMNQRYQDGHDQDTLGIYMELENASLHKHLKYTIWELEGLNVVFIGKSPRGLHQRVWYFENTKVP